jgi:hypothetical protein
MSAADEADFQAIVDSVQFNQLTELRIPQFSPCAGVRPQRR